jgi:hypothetical protein
MVLKKIKKMYFDNGSHSIILIEMRKKKLIKLSTDV